MSSSISEMQVSDNKPKASLNDNVILDPPLMALLDHGTLIKGCDRFSVDILNCHVLLSHQVSKGNIRAFCLQILKLGIKSFAYLDPF